MVYSAVNHSYDSKTTTLDNPPFLRIIPQTRQYFEELGVDPFLPVS